MLRNYFFVNIVLVIIIGLLSIRLYDKLVLSKEIPFMPTSEVDSKAQELPKSNAETVNEESYKIISDMNIFSPERKPHKTSDIRKTEKPVPGKMPRLFGTIITDISKSAIIEDAVTNTTRMYAINDSVSGYVISDILNDRIIVLSDGEKLEIKLREDKGIQPSVQPPSAFRPLPAPRAERSVPVQRQRPRRIPRQITPEAEIQQEEAVPPEETPDESMQQPEEPDKPDNQ